jgi:hypothetical protein
MICTVLLVALVVLSSSTLSLGASDETLTQPVSHPATIGAALEAVSSSIDSLSAPVSDVSTSLGSGSQDCEAGDVEVAIDKLLLAVFFVPLLMLPLVGNLLSGLRELSKLESLYYQPLERPG